jgi:hypothetical protein
MLRARTEKTSQWVAVAVVVYYACGYAAAGLHSPVAQLAIAMTAGLAVGVVVRVSATPAPARMADSPPQQIVGMPCVACGKTLLTMLDGETCRHCDGPLHHACRAGHVS